MAKRKHIKPYAVELVKAIRQDARTIVSRVPTAMDLADVIAVKPQIIISPQNSQVDYDEDYLVFQIDPDSLEVDDVVVIGRDPSGQPIVLGKADWSNPDPMLDPDIVKLAKDLKKLKKNAGHIKPSVKALQDLPNDGNSHGDTVIVEDNNSIQTWDGEQERWNEVLGTDNFVDTTGDNMTGNLVMEPGSMVTINDPPTNPTDATNKVYVDAAVAAASVSPLFPTTTVNANYSILATDSVLLVDSSGGAVTLTLPAGHVNGEVYFVKDTMGTTVLNPISIVTPDADTIDGQASFTLTTPRQAATLVSDGANWHLL